MRAKRYFWNMKHHRELDRQMGLLKKLSGPMAKLCEACGMDTIIDGTRGIMPIFLFNDLDKLLPDKMRSMITYDCLSNEKPHRFFRVQFSRN